MTDKRVTATTLTTNSTYQLNTMLFQNNVLTPRTPEPSQDWSDLKASLLRILDEVEMLLSEWSKNESLASNSTPNQ